jgi:hypothetical protein
MIIGNKSDKILVPTSNDIQAYAKKKNYSWGKVSALNNKNIIKCIEGLALQIFLDKEMWKYQDVEEVKIEENFRNQRANMQF